MVRLTLLQVFLIWVAGFGTVSILARRKVATLASEVRLPCVVKYYIIATPIILLEESLTLEVPYFWGIIPILAAFYVLFLPLYVIQRVTRCSFVFASLLFGAMGCFNEFILVGRIRSLDGPVLLIMCPLCFLIYAVMAIMPSYYLQVSRKPYLAIPKSRNHRLARS